MLPLSWERGYLPKTGLPALGVTPFGAGRRPGNLDSTIYQQSNDNREKGIPHSSFGRGGGADFASGEFSWVPSFTFIFLRGGTPPLKGTFFLCSMALFQEPSFSFYSFGAYAQGISNLNPAPPFRGGVGGRVPLPLQGGVVAIPPYPFPLCLSPAG